MPNILPETKVRGSLLVDKPQAEGKGYTIKALLKVLLMKAPFRPIRNFPALTRAPFDRINIF